jgi:conjugal transfer pilus assembly protein TrbC
VAAAFPDSNARRLKVAKINCWEFKKCNRTAERVLPGVRPCPVVTAAEYDGVHDGVMAGRACWVVAGSMCGGKTQGEFAAKFDNCKTCGFFRLVKEQEERPGSSFVATPHGMTIYLKLRKSGFSRRILSGLIAFVISTAALTAVSAELDQNSVNKIIEKRDAALESMVSPTNMNDKDARERATRIMNKVNSGEYQDRIRAKTEHLKATIFSGYSGSALSKTSATANSAADKRVAGRLSPDERLYVFISSSMPVATIRNYAAAIDRISDPNVVFVVRGFVGGMKKWKDMLAFSSAVLAREPGCDFSKERCDVFDANLQVDPLLFRRYGITSVPAFVYVRGVSRQDPVLSEGLETAAHVGAFYSVRGDASLGYVLDTIRQETGSASIISLIAVLERSRQDGE